MNFKTVNIKGVKIKVEDALKIVQFLDQNFLSFKNYDIVECMYRII